MSSDKARLRDDMVARRRHLAPAVRAQAEAAWAAQFNRYFRPPATPSQPTHAYDESERSGSATASCPPFIVAGYIATDGELDIGSSLNALRAGGQAIALPSTDAQEGLSFRLWPDETALVAGRYGILEATGPACVPDLILLPLVACSRSGGRLGRGGGYYDRWLSAHRSGCFGLGVAFSFQCVDTVPMDDLDQGLDGIMTPDGLITCPSAEGERENWRLGRWADLWADA